MKRDVAREEALKAVLKKIDCGDGLTDEELTRAIEFFTDLEWRLLILGPHFHHAWKDVYFKLQAFEEFARTRARKF